MVRVDRWQGVDWATQITFNLNKKKLSNLNIYISMPHVLWWCCEYDRKKFKVLCGNARLEVKEDEGEEEA